MSYIRCSSNPERLYIWGPNKNGMIEVCHRVQPPLASKVRKGEFPVPRMQIPVRIFYSACVRWDDGDEEISVRGFRVRYLYVYEDTGRVARPSARDMLRPDARPRRFVVRLDYKGAFVYLWRVTWEYVVRSACRFKDDDHGRKRKGRRREPRD